MIEMGAVGGEVIQSTQNIIIAAMKYVFLFPPALLHQLTLLFKMQYNAHVFVAFPLLSKQKLSE